MTILYSHATLLISFIDHLFSHNPCNSLFLLSPPRHTKATRRIEAKGHASALHLSISFISSFLVFGNRHAQLPRHLLHRPSAQGAGRRLAVPSALCVCGACVQYFECTAVRPEEESGEKREQDCVLSSPFVLFLYHDELLTYAFTGFFVHHVLLPPSLPSPLSAVSVAQHGARVICFICLSSFPYVFSLSSHRLAVACFRVSVSLPSTPRVRSHSLCFRNIALGLDCRFSGHFESCFFF